MRSTLQRVIRITSRSLYITKPSSSHITLSRNFSRTNQSGGCDNCACQQSAVSSTSSSSECSSTKPARVECDPYSQGGHPLEPNVVDSLVNTLDEGWKTNEKHRSLIRQFDFRNVGQSAMFSFVTSLQNLSINGGHPFYSMQIIPRKSRVEVELHTISLHGLSYADFAFATQCDGTYRRIARVIPTC